LSVSNACQDRKTDKIGGDGLDGLPQQTAETLTVVVDLETRLSAFQDREFKERKIGREAPDRPQLDGAFKSTQDCPAVRTRVTLSRVAGLPCMNA
jgi:hypothetical protein